MAFLASATCTVVWLLSLVRVCLSQTGFSLIPCQTGHPGTNTSLLSSTPVGSLLDCAVRCRQQSRCDVIHLCGNECMTLEWSENVTSSPLEKNSSCLCYEKLCKDGGVENMQGSCICRNGFVGARCEELLGDCMELFRRLGNLTLTTHLIYPKASPAPFDVHCGVYGGTYMAFRQTNSVDFNRTWQEYVEGFGDLDGWSPPFWRGLKYWHYLTASKNYRLGVGVRGVGGVYYTKTFRYFKVGDEASNFTATFTSAQGNLTFDQQQFNGSQFSTFDRDHDTSADTHCAQLHGGGWWFSDCGDSNPTGPLLSPPGGLRLGTPAEAFWEGSMQNMSIYVVSMALVPEST